MKLIDPNKVYNHWIFSKPGIYGLINSLDIEIKKDEKIKNAVAMHGIFNKKKQQIYLSNFLLVKEINNIILQRVKKEKLLRKYDALVISSIINLKDSLMVSLDCFKRIK